MRVMALIGTKIRYHRKKKGLTLEQLADGICSVSYLSKIEHGDKSSKEISCLLCDRLGISYIDEDEENKEQLNQIDQELDDFYASMLHSPIIAALSPTKESLKRKLATVNDPSINLKFELFSFCFNAMSENFSEAEDIKLRLNTFKDLLDPKQLYYYEVFNGIYCCNIAHMEEGSQSLYTAERLLPTIRHTEQEEAEMYYQISRMETLSYHVPKSINYANRALNIFNKTYNMKRIADCQTLLGICNRRIFNFADAEYHYEQALKFVTILGNDERRAILYHNLAFCHRGQNHFDKAIDLLQKSLDIKRHDNVSTSSLVFTIAAIAETFLVLNDFEKVKDYVDQGLALVAPSDDSVDYIRLKVVDLKISGASYSTYENYIRQKVIPALSKRNMWDMVAEFAEELASYFFEHGQYKLSSLYYRQANDSRKKLYNRG